LNAFSATTDCTASNLSVGMPTIYSPLQAPGKYFHFFRKNAVIERIAAMEEIGSETKSATQHLGKKLEELLRFRAMEIGW